MTAWAAPLGGQLDLLARWLEPIVERPGLEPVPAADLRIELGESDRDEPPAFEPFDALVGPVRIDESGVVAEVIPEERFAELRALLDVVGGGPPLVVFARSDGTHAYDPIEAVASEAVVVRTVVAVS